MGHTASSSGLLCYASKCILRASDEEQLRFASSHGRAVVTHDVDFLRRAAAGVVHTGIVNLRPEKRTPGEMIRRLVLVWELLGPDEMRGHVE